MSFGKGGGKGFEPGMRTERVFSLVAAVSGPTRSCGQPQQPVRPTAGLEPQPDGRGHRVDDQPQLQRYLQQHIIRAMIWKVERQRQAEKNDIRRLLLSRDLSEGTELGKMSSSLEYLPHLHY
jgi:hypothetical protein